MADKYLLVLLIKGKTIKKTAAASVGLCMWYKCISMDVAEWCSTLKLLLHDQIFYDKFHVPNVF